MASTQVIRVTMFKVPKKEDQEAMIKYYAEMFKVAVKDGRPYILSVEAGPTYPNPSGTSEGYNFVGKSVFKNLEDMMYYDQECEAHKAFKAKAKANLQVEGIMSVWFTPGFSASI